MKKILLLSLIIIGSITLLSAGCSIKKVDNSNQVGQSSDIKYSGRQGATALQLLREKYRVETQSLSSGEFVKSINGTAADQNHYWTFYINGQESMVRPGQYVTKDADSIEWKMQQTSSGI